jgi:hypothetical protein
MRRSRALLAFASLLAMGLSGCAGGDDGSAVAGTPDDEDIGVIVDATGQEREVEPPSRQTVETSEGVVAVNKGLLVGRVRDGGNYSIAGARVDILGTEMTTKTDFQGRFRFENATPGLFDVYVLASGFAPKQVRANIRAGEEEVLDIEMLPKAGQDPGMVPHVHDYWGAQTEHVLRDDVVVFDRDLTGKPGGLDPLAPNTPKSIRWPFYLPEQDDGKPGTIWPGTKEIHFKVSWEDSPETKIPHAGIVLKTRPTAAEQDLGKATNGGTLVYVLNAANETDIGHQSWSRWTFWVYVDNYPGSSPPAGAQQWSPSLGLDGVNVEVKIIKGDLALEIAHQDFWGANETLVIGDRDAVHAPTTGVPPSSSSQTCNSAGCTGTWVLAIKNKPGGVNIIPPGTDKVKVKLSWSHFAGSGATGSAVTLPFTYSLTYRTSDMHPRDTPASEYKVPKKVGGDGATFVEYEIDASSQELDGFYETSSGWGFKWYVDGNPGYQTGFFTRFKLDVTAIKDPTY